jgi:para-aminobenzoate synthetase/4-amino-4-deoxychorismate lyase
VLPVARLDAPAGSALHDRIQTIRARIREGDVYQVNLTTVLRSTLTGGPDAYFAALARAQPHGYLFRVAHDLDGVPERILSVSPELFFHWKDGSIRAQPMKGTAPRGRRRPTPPPTGAWSRATRNAPRT